MFIGTSIYAAVPGPLYQHTDTLDQREFINIYQQIPSTFTVTVTTGNVALVNGLIPNAEIDGSSVTKQGNVFNGNNQLLKLNGSGVVPNSVLNGVTSASMTVTNLTFPNTGLFDSGIQVLPIVQIQKYTTTTSSSVTSASFTNTLLSGSFTPKFSTSKLVIWAAGDLAQQTGASVGYATIARNGTNLAAGSGGFTLTVAGNNYATNMLAYDSPATTSAITYSVQIRTNGGGTAIFPITDGGSFTSTANMIITEIAQ